MAFAQGSRSSLSYGVETTFGTAAAGSYQNLPFTTHSLNLSKDRVAGNDIQSDRMKRTDRHGNRQVSGDIVVDLRDGDYDVLLESAMFNTWTLDVLKVGTTPKYLTVEDYAADIDQAKLYTGMAVSQFGVSMGPNQMVVGTFGMVGKDMTVTATEKTQTAASGAAPYDSYSGALKIADTGGVLTNIGTVVGLDFTLNNSLSPTFVIGSDSAPQLEHGMAEVEGTITAYVEDDTLLNRFLNETETAFEVQVGDGTNTLTFLFPRVKLNDAANPVNGPTSRVITIPFVSLYDTTEESNLVITRA